jgi:hypothetical protein
MSSVQRCASLRGGKDAKTEELEHEDPDEEPFDDIEDNSDKETGRDEESASGSREP